MSQDRRAEDKRLLTTEDLAERWGMSAGTLENWRQDGRGPKFVKLGRGGSGSVRYRMSDILSYEKQHVVQPKENQ